MSLLETYYRWGGVRGVRVSCAYMIVVCEPSKWLCVQDNHMPHESEQNSFCVRIGLFAVELAFRQKCWLAKNSLFGKNYCGGVSHSNRKTGKLDLCPTIVGPKFQILASDTKSISEAWQKAVEDWKAVCLIVAQNLLVVQTTIVLESERQQASLDCPALKLMMSYVSIQASCRLARV